jgi:hypothetical protein
LTLQTGNSARTGGGGRKENRIDEKGDMNLKEKKKISS